VQARDETCRRAEPDKNRENENMPDEKNSYSVDIIWPENLASCHSDRSAFVERPLSANTPMAGSVPNQGSDASTTTQLPSPACCPFTHDLVSPIPDTDLHCQRRQRPGAIILGRGLMIVTGIVVVEMEQELRIREHSVRRSVSLLSRFPE
jgi:hypothetical protein